MEILAKALDYERIVLDAFLKVLLIKLSIDLQETRKLAREQFLVKALIQKILKAAGIAGVEGGYVNGGPAVPVGGLTSAEFYYSQLAHQRDVDRWRIISVQVLEFEA